MRLWHQDLIHYLPRQQLLGQHRECCALRGKGWGRKHSVVDYVFKYGLDHLYEYHRIVMCEMIHRGYCVLSQWFNRTYRGKTIGFSTLLEVGSFVYQASNGLVYSEHDDEYLCDCIKNLMSKNALLVNGKLLEEMQLKLALAGKWKS